MGAVTLVTVQDCITRERIFKPVQARKDRKDLIAQIAVLLEQLMDEKFSGQIYINCVSGGVANVTAKQSQKVAKNNT